LNYSISGTAEADDYSSDAENGLIAQDDSAIITFSGKVDQTFEGEESIVVTLLPGIGYQLGSQATHTVTLRDNPDETWVDYLFILSANTPGLSTQSDSELPPVMPARKVSLTLTLGGDKVIGARINEHQSFGFVDDDPHLDSIRATDIRRDKGNLTLVFHYGSVALGLVGGPSLTSLTVDPRVDFPKLADDDRKKLQNTLVLSIDHFTVPSQATSIMPLQGTFSIESSGVLTSEKALTVTGIVQGILQL